jgi:hypothetical protein
MKRKKIRLTESQLKTLVLLIKETKDLEELSHTKDLEELDEKDEKSKFKFSALKGFRKALKTALDQEIKSIESLYA